MKLQVNWKTVTIGIVINLLYTGGKYNKKNFNNNEDNMEPKIIIIIKIAYLNNFLLKVLKLNNPLNVKEIIEAQ